MEREASAERLRMWHRNIRIIEIAHSNVGQAGAPPPMT